jgi:hypothetical protein
VENWKNALEAVDAYKEKESQLPVQSTVSTDGKIVIEATAGKLNAQAKLYIALAGLVAAAAAALGLLAGKL